MAKSKIFLERRYTRTAIGDKHLDSNITVCMSSRQHRGFTYKTGSHHSFLSVFKYWNDKFLVFGISVRALVSELLVARLCASSELSGTNIVIAV